MLYFLTDEKLAALLDRAIQVAMNAHAGQRDRGGLPYILHPLRLMLQLSTPAAMMTAILHDVVEDSPWTLEDLKKEGFPAEVLAAVDALTRREDESYEAYLQRVKQNPLALEVKLRDLEDNINALRLAELDEHHCKSLQRYHRAFRFLTNPTE